MKYRIIEYTTVTDTYIFDASNKESAQLQYENARERGLLNEYIEKSDYASESGGYDIEEVS